MNQTTYFIGGGLSNEGGKGEKTQASRPSATTVRPPCFSSRPANQAAGQQLVKQLSRHCNMGPTRFPTGNRKVFRRNFGREIRAQNGLGSAETQRHRPSRSQLSIRSHAETTNSLFRNRSAGKTFLAMGKFSDISHPAERKKATTLSLILPETGELAMDCIHGDPFIKPQNLQ